MSNRQRKMAYPDVTILVIIFGLNGQSNLTKSKDCRDHQTDSKARSGHLLSIAL